MEELFSYKFKSLNLKNVCIAKNIFIIHALIQEQMH